MSKPCILPTLPSTAPHVIADPATRQFTRWIRLEETLIKWKATFPGVPVDVELVLNTMNEIKRNT